MYTPTNIIRVHIHIQRKGQPDKDYTICIRAVKNQTLHNLSRFSSGPMCRRTFEKKLLWGCELST